LSLITNIKRRAFSLFVSLTGFWVCGNKICQTIRDEIFFPPHIILGVGKQRDLENKFYQIVGDALTMDTYVFSSFFWCSASVLNVYCKCFSLFRTYVIGVSSECCKSRSGIAQVAMRVRSGGGTSGPFVRSSGAGPCGRTKCRLGQRRAGPSTRNGSAGFRTDFWLLALLNFF
jgi:hypothetical protein